jgi:uncharacterized protein (TIGR03067 family)
MRAILPSAVIMICCAASPALAQSDAVDNELKRIDGHWRVIEMVENGNAIPEDQMREWLPGGGVMEIVDYTVIFKSPVDGTKSTKYFRVDPTSYPKRIAIMERDATTGTGIYKFDQGKLVICVTNSKGELPTEFSAPTGSNRTLLILSRFEPGTSEIPGLNAKLPERQPVHIPSPAPAPATAQIQPPPVAAPAPAVVPETTPARSLTDTEVRNMALGTWRINDTEGSVDIVFRGDGVFQTYRYFRTLSNFQYVFVPTPSSSGNWSVVNGRLMANVTSSTRADRVNQAFAPSVRSISGSDMILEDQLGRVSRAVKLR